jgi:hypothetical protein
MKGSLRGRELCFRQHVYAFARELASGLLKYQQTSAF